MTRRPFLFFDVGGTLLHPRRDLAASLAREAGSGVDADAARVALEGAFAAATKGGPDPCDMGANRRWWFDVYRRFLAGVGAETADAGSTDEVCERFWARHRLGDFLVPAGDARATLEALRSRGYRTGVISNWDDTLEPILERYELGEGFEAVVTSFAVGAAKPDRRIFEAALGLAGVEASDAVLVGDDWRADVGGARAAGLRPIFLGEPPVGDGCARVAALGELPALFAAGGF